MATAIKDIQLEDSTAAPLDRTITSDSSSIDSTPPTNNNNNNNISIHPSSPLQNPTQPAEAPFLPSSLFTASATPNRLLFTKQTNTSSHRRNQSHGHILSFPKFSMPPNLVITNPTPDNQFNPFSSGARSVPSTPGVTPLYPLQSNGAMGQSTTTTGFPIYSTTTAAAAITVPTGGTPSSGGENYTLADRTSSVTQTIGHTPPPLIGSTTVIHNNHLYLFGGRPPGKTPTNDLYILNLDTNEWTLVNQEQQQQQACQHASDSDEEIEQSNSTDQSEDDTHSLGGCVPPKVKKSKGPSDVGFSPLCTIPQPRYYHSATLVVAPPILDSNGSIKRWGSEDEAHLVIFGGRGLSQKGSGEICLNDTHILDLRSLQWIPSNLDPNHDNVEVTNDQKIVSDEVIKHERPEKESLDLNSTGIPTQASEGSVPSVKNHQHNPFRFHTPEPRSAHVTSITGDHLLIIGGLNIKNEYIHSVSVLDLKRNVWMDGGDFRGNASQYRASSSSIVEKPMARRRRRYLESLAAETLQHQQRPLSIHGALSSLSRHSPTLSDATTACHKDMSPLSPKSQSTVLSSLLNPRKNSWHRGEGLPFEIPKSPPNIHHQLGNETSSLSSMIEPDDYVWVDDGKPQDSGFIGLGMDMNTQEAQDAAASVWPPSIAANTKSPHMSAQTNVPSTKIALGSVFDKTRSRSSSVQSSTPSKAKGASPVTHAVSKTFFSKSNGGLFELDGLATTIARDNKSNLPKGSESPSHGSISSDKQTQLRRCSSNGASSVSSCRSSGAVDDNMVRRRFRRDLDVDDKADKRRSLDSVLDSVNILESSFAEGRVGLSDNLKPQCIPTPYSQPLYVYSNRTATDNKLKREFIKVQPAKGLYRPGASKVSFETKPEWTALDLGPDVNAGARNQSPPKLYFPSTHIVDNNFILSGNTVYEEEIPVPGEQDSPNGASTVFATNTAVSKRRRRSFSVWVHQFHNHQWSQLELSKSLYAGVWNHSVLDRERNFLYILGQRKSGPNQPNLDADSGTELALSVTSFTHMIKVDLEGLEISPDVDESCVGASGVRLGLEMLKDGVGADVVLVSSVDGGRVRANSGIIGQRWGYFQLLMEEDSRVKSMEMEYLKSKQVRTQDEESSVETDSTRTSLDTDATFPKLASKKQCLSDTPPEIMVRESTPILVAFLQYLYTNELVTPHQLKIKTLQGLLLVSHFYDLTRLQQLVRRAIHQQLNAKNAPAVCEVAVLTLEFGLQTRALRALLQSARMTQMRQLGEAAEKRRRFEFAMCRLEEIEEDRKRKESMKANQILLQQAGQQTNLMSGITSGNNSSDSLNNGITKNTTQAGVSASSSTPVGTGLSAFGRFFRHREESVESVGPLV
ncbi:hypothetical protein BGZ76_009215 [Entomortierella beljakovae]|nr:hypothetical protein BGZ76_009215 [Entomortierella beljakovae]